MQRVLVLGCGGAGKSTLAHRLGEITGLPVIHLDAEYWRPGWVETPKEPWRARVRELVARERWIMDGNYADTLELRLPAADTIIFLDCARWRCLLRVFRRVAANAGRTRPDMGPGCPEKLDLEFLRWVWSFNAGDRQKVLQALHRHSSGKALHVLRTPCDARRFVQSLEEQV